MLSEKWKGKPETHDNDLQVTVMGMYVNERTHDVENPVSRSVALNEWITTYAKQFSEVAENTAQNAEEIFEKVVGHKYNSLH